MGQNRVSLLSLSILIILMLCGCNHDLDSKQGETAAERKLYVSFECKPKRWQPGDTLKLVFESISKIDGIIADNPAIAIPNLQKPEFVFEGSIVSALWATDSVPFLDEDGKYVLLEGNFLDTALNLRLRTEAIFNILLDSTGYYHFEQNIDSYTLDTFEIE